MPSPQKGAGIILWCQTEFLQGPFFVPMKLASSLSLSFHPQVLGPLQPHILISGLMGQGTRE